MAPDLSHVYWIGGSGCSGKSSIARILEKEHGFTAYHCDDHWGEHESRCTPAENPATLRVRGNMVEYLQLAPVEFEEASRAWFKEDFAMVLEDLDSMPSDAMVVEGVTLEPEFVLEVAKRQRAIFIIASEEFQREYFLKRDMQSQFFQSLPDPEGSFEAFMDNLALQTSSLRKRAEQLGLRVIITDENNSFSSNLELVKEHFDL